MKKQEQHKPTDTIKIVHGLFIIRMTGSGLLFHDLFIIRMTGSGLLFKVVSYLLLLLYASLAKMSTPQKQRYKTPI